MSFSKSPPHTKPHRSRYREERVVVAETRMPDIEVARYNVETTLYSSGSDEHLDDIRHLRDDATDGVSIVKNSLTKKILLSVMAALLLFACGITGGLLLMKEKSELESTDTSVASTPSKSSDKIDADSAGWTFVDSVSQNLQNATNDIETSSSENEGINASVITNTSQDVILTVDPTYTPTVSPTVQSTGKPTNQPTLPPTGNPTSTPSSAPTVITADVIRVPIPLPMGESSQSVVPASDFKYDYRENSKDFLVGVYYYPWHGENFHNREGYVRKDIVPRQYPVLGEYNDSDPAVVKEHMEMFRKGNIGLLVTSWWGPGRIQDKNIKDVIMTHEDVGNLKIALHYETFGRLGREVDRIENARSDILYMCENYFDHPNYYRIDGRPVVFLYLTRNLHSKGRLEEALLTMRSTANKCGQNLYIVGDHSFGKSTVNTDEPHLPFWYMDAVTNYDVYGSSGRPSGYVGKEGVMKHYKYQSDWKQAASKDNCQFIPSVSPGYNDRGVRLESDHPALSRRIATDAEEGSLFYFQLKEAKKLVDKKVDNLIMVNSFNEWHEDTQIEPVAIGDSANWPPLMTEGLEYVGYGDLYLNILGASTVSRDHQGIFDHLYN